MDLESTPPSELSADPRGWTSQAWVTPERYFLLRYPELNNSTVIWDPVRSEEVGQPWNPGVLRCYTYTRNGRWRVMLNSVGAGIIVDRDHGGKSMPIDLSAQGTTDGCFSPDGAILAVADHKGYIGLWKTADLAGGGTVRPFAKLGVSTLSYHTSSYGVQFSPDGRRLAGFARRAEAVHLWDVQSLQEVFNLSRGKDSELERAQFSPDGTVLGGRSFDGKLYLWRAPALSEIDAAEAQPNAKPRS
jgi:WD40 repeat protein